MADPQFDKMYGLDAFKKAIARQEGTFMRGATYIMNAPKQLSTTTADKSKKSDNRRIAEAAQERNLKGQFVKKDGDGDGE